MRCVIQHSLKIKEVKKARDILSSNVVNMYIPTSVLFLRAFDGDDSTTRGLAAEYCACSIRGNLEPAGNAR